jgi:hypothetical protein
MNTKQAGRIAKMTIGVLLIIAVIGYSSALAGNPHNISYTISDRAEPRQLVTFDDRPADPPKPPLFDY